MLDDLQRLRVAERANLAPSVHNTQPARWRFELDGSITILADRRRILSIGDPGGRDAVISCGAALEGTMLALAELGYQAAKVTDLWRSGNRSLPFIPVANLAIRPGEISDTYSMAMDRRATWRGGFLAVGHSLTQPLARWAAERDDLTLVSDRADIEMLAALNDTVSLQFYRNDPYRDELVHWMRLSRSHPDYSRDGMNLDALHLGTMSGHAARLAFQKPLFGLIDRLGVAGRLLSERDKTLSSSAIALFHRSREESPVLSGRALYRMWLELTRLGVAAWPMAVLADDPDAAAACAARFRVPDGHRIINILRIGLAPRAVPRARRAPEEIVVSS